MTDVVWCIPTCGITYSVSHHDECRLVHPDMWYHLNAILHHDGCRLVHPTKWEHFFIAIRHHDGCRLVHPAKWDIGQFRGAFVRMPIDASRQAVHSIYRFNSRCQELTDSFTIQFIILIYSVFKYHISIPYSLSYYLFKDILNLCTHFIYSFTYSIHILIHVLISYTHSCTHFMVTW